MRIEAFTRACLLTILLKHNNTKTMKIFGPIYDTVIAWAKHRHGEYYLGCLSFAESSFFPIPPDVMLAPMVMARRDRAWRLALITTITSVLGGLLGYALGAFFFDAYGDAVLSAFNAHETFAKVQQSYIEHGMLIILLAGLTPIPYKIITIASGVVGVAILPFVAMSLIGRGLRFFLVAAIVKFGGDQFEETIHKQIEWLGWSALVLLVAAYLAYRQFAH